MQSLASIPHHRSISTCASRFVSRTWAKISARRKIVSLTISQQLPLIIAWSEIMCAILLLLKECGMTNARIYVSNFTLQIVIFGKTNANGRSKKDSFTSRNKNYTFVDFMYREPERRIENRITIINPGVSRPFFYHQRPDLHTIVRRIEWLYND